MRQFISTYNRVKDLKGDELMWGDEIEYGIFILDEDNKKVRLSLRAKEVRSIMFYIIFDGTRVKGKGERLNGVLVRTSRITK